MRHSTQTRRIIINDHLINYYLLQSAEQPSGVILFLHGWRSEGAVWLPLMERLAGLGGGSYSIDLPGFGKSRAPTSPWHVSDYANVVQSFIEKLGLKSVTLVGHSFGGRVAIKLAATHPDAIGKLILVSSAGIRAEPRMKTLKFVAAKILKPFFAPTFMQPLRRKLYALIGAEDYILTPKLQQTFRNVASEDLIPFLPRIQADTLIIWGKKDRVTRLNFAQRMARAIPRSRLVILPGAGHFSFLDQPEEFFQAVTEFLKRPHA